MEDELDTRISNFQNAPTFTHLPLAAIRELAGYASVRHFKKGDIIFRQGDPCSFFYLMHRGRAKCFKQLASGKQQIVFVVKDLETLNAVVLLSGNPHSLTAKAMENASVYCVKRELYVSWTHRHPSHLLRITAMMEQALSASYEKLIHVVGERVHDRLYRVLHMLYGKFGPSLDFTCEEIAEIAGTTTETAIRILTQLKSEQVLRPVRGEIHVLNPAELERLSQGYFYIPGRI